MFSAHDGDHTFYWGSHRDSQHSRNVLANGRAFVVVYDSTVPPGTGAGVYFRAKAEELTDVPEIAAARLILEARHRAPYWKLEEVGPSSSVGLYRAVPEEMWVNDDGAAANGTFIDIRREVRFGSQR